jgi:arginine repressor
VGKKQEIQETMARTKGVNKTSAVQDYLSKNSAATAPEVVDALKAHGIEVTAGHVYNVKATMKKKKSAKKAAKKKAGPKAAASTNGATKADHIRDQAKSMPKPVRPKDVVAALKDRGVEVLHTHVSQILASMGMKKRKRRRKMAVSGAAPAVASNGLNINDLVAAKKLVAQVGSVEKVREALAALARLS